MLLLASNKMRNCVCDECGKAFIDMELNEDDRVDCETCPECLAKMDKELGL